MTTEIDYDWMEYDDGTVGLIFNPPKVDAFLAAGLHGDGQDWMRLLQYFLPRVAPRALTGTLFGPESNMFVAINRDRAALQEMAAVVQFLLSDEPALGAIIRGMQAAASR